jgi:hypothetical protein
MADEDVIPVLPQTHQRQRSRIDGTKNCPTKAANALGHLVRSKLLEAQAHAHQDGNGRDGDGERGEIFTADNRSVRQ